MYNSIRLKNYFLILKSFTLQLFENKLFILNFRIRLGYLVLGVVNEYVHPNLILRALVGNLVALCKVDNDHPKIKKAKNGNSLSSPRVICKPPALPCFGYGILSFKITKDL